MSWRDYPPGGGVKLGKYNLEQRLGKGGMGEVWLGHHPDLDIPVAIKTMSPTLLLQDPGYGERFMTEARTAARLNHPHVVRVFDCGVDEGTRYIVMEYVDGGTVGDRLRALKGPLPADTALRIVTAVAEALAAAAELRIIHRDIKPDNIMLTQTGVAKLADLGLAKCTDQTESNLTGTGILMGSPFYMAPEQARDAKSADIRADIYALGASYYQMLTGDVPYRADTMMGTILLHLQTPLPDPRLRNPALTAGQSAVLHMMMAKSTADRYQTPLELLDDLRRLANPGSVVRDLRAFHALPAGETQLSASNLVEQGLPPLTPGLTGSSNVPAGGLGLRPGPGMGLAPSAGSPGGVDTRARTLNDGSGRPAVTPRPERGPEPGSTAGPQTRANRLTVLEERGAGEAEQLANRQRLMMLAILLLVVGVLGVALFAATRRKAVTPGDGTAPGDTLAMTPANPTVTLTPDAPPLAIATGTYMPRLGTPFTPETTAQVVFTPIPAGTFQMGEPGSEPTSDTALHAVRITRPFWMARTEVTVKQFNYYVAAHGESDAWKAELSRGVVEPVDGGWVLNPALTWRNASGGEDYPVVGVSWSDAMDYCAWLNERERYSGRLPEGYVYRLPTEAEWEFAARGGTPTTALTDRGLLAETAWHRDVSGGKVQLAGTRRPNAYGLYDMLGNAAEWTLDRTRPNSGHPDAPPTSSINGQPISDPVSLDGVNHIYRGGSALALAKDLRASERQAGEVALRGSLLGFRPVLAPAIPGSSR